MGCERTHGAQKIRARGTPKMIEQPEAWNSPTWREQRDAALLEWFGGDRDAVSFLQSISQITEFFDDVCDSDKDITAPQLGAALLQAVVGLPANPFYTKHREYLTPIIIQAVNAWHTSNTLAQGSKSERAIAYTLRNYDIHLVEAIIFITRGYEKMREISPQIWIMFAAEQDDILAWVGESA